MKRIFHISHDFSEAELWDINQQVNLGPEKRQQAAKELKIRVFGKNPKDVRDSPKKEMKASHFSPDIQEFLFLLSTYKVKYVIVGGEAVIYYGFARLTGDVDFFYDSAAGNVQLLYRALDEFWKGSIPGIQSAGELAAKSTILQFGVPPNRIDLINSITGVPFKEAWRFRTREEIIIKKRPCRIFFIGLDQLIKNKEAVSRHKDFEDLKYLRTAAKKRRKSPIGKRAEER